MFDSATAAAYVAASTAHGRSTGVRDELGSGTLTAEFRDAGVLAYAGTFQGPVQANADGSMSIVATLAGAVAQAFTISGDTWTLRVRNEAGRYIEGTLGPTGRFVASGTAQVGTTVRLNILIAAQDMLRWVGVPSPIEVSVDAPVDLSQYVQGGKPPYGAYGVDSGTLPDGASIDHDTGVLSVTAGAALVDTDGLEFGVSDAESLTAAELAGAAIAAASASATLAAGGAGAWANRSTDTDVLWAHGFENDAELENFVRLGAATNPDPATLPNPLALVATPFGSARAIRSRAVGTPITADVPSVAKLATQTIAVGDASLFPDPTGAIGQYSVYIGCADPDGQNTSPAVFEECTLLSRDTGANTLTVQRNVGNYSIVVAGVSYASGSANAPAIPGASASGLYRIGYTNSGSWNRPMCCFPATQNGRASADIGITNGAAAKTRTWDPTRGGTGHKHFREGYWGHRHYWDPAVNAAAPYKDWTPTYTGDGQNVAHTDAFEGDEFYLQFRFKVTQARLQGDIAKLFYIQSAAQSGPGQLFAQVGQQRYSIQPPPAELQGGSTVGCPLLVLAGGGDGRQPAGGWFAGTIQTDGFDAGAEPWHVDYPSGYFARKDLADCYAFTHQSDVWVTMLIHMKLGRDNAEAHHPAGAGTDGYTGPFPAASDATYRTILEVKVALPGWSAYKTLFNVQDAAWFFGDDLGEVGKLLYNAPGLSAFWMTQEFNMYVGGGSLCPPNGIASAEFAQPILSRAPIPVPED